MKSFTEILSDNVALRVGADRVNHSRLTTLLDYDVDDGLFRWKVFRGGMLPGSVAGAKKSNGYLHVSIDGKFYMLHRLAIFYVTGRWPIEEIDHVDGNKTNNSYINLRDASRQQNAFNLGLRRDNKSGVKGVVYSSRDKKWVTWITHNYASVYLGGFDTIDLAIEARRAAATQLFGQFASEVCR